MSPASSTPEMAAPPSGMRLPQSLAAWQTPDFEVVFKQEVKQLDADLLPLQQGLSHSSRAVTSNLGITLLRVNETQHAILIKAGIFYAGIIAGCSCADDPTPIDEVNEYCELEFSIDKRSGAATVALLQD